MVPLNRARRVAPARSRVVRRQRPDDLIEALRSAVDGRSPDAKRVPASNQACGCGRETASSEVGDQGDGLDHRVEGVDIAVVGCWVGKKIRVCLHACCTGHV